MVLNIVLRAVMISAFRIRYTGSGLIDAMVQFEHEPAMRSVLTGAKATIKSTGEKKVL
jgi:hypothetical protein